MRTIRFLLCDDCRIRAPRAATSCAGKIDANGTRTFEEVDDWAIEGSFVAPWIRLGQAAS